MSEFKNSDSRAQEAGRPCKLRHFPVANCVICTTQPAQVCMDCYAKLSASNREALRVSLRTHWLSEIECNHYEHNDSAICACGWKSDRGFNVGKAVEFWVTHVFESPRDNLAGLKEAGASDKLVTALERIRNGAEFCECDHTTEDCCNNCAPTDFTCPFCIADVALKAELANGK